MEKLTAIFETQTIANIVVAVMVVEGISLIVLRSRLGLRIYDVFAMLFAGLFLVLALRAALTGAGWEWIAAFLGAAFAAHMLDLRRQIQRR